MPRSLRSKRHRTVVNLGSLQSWLEKPPRRVERALAAAICVFAGFWLGGMLASATCRLADWPNDVAISVGLFAGVSSGFVIGWRYPKQSLCVFGARALFRSFDDRSP